MKKRIGRQRGKKKGPMCRIANFIKPWKRRYTDVKHLLEEREQLARGDGRIVNAFFYRCLVGL